MTCQEFSWSTAVMFVAFLAFCAFMMSKWVK